MSIQAMKQARKIIQIYAPVIAKDADEALDALDAAIEAAQKVEPITDAVMNLVDRLGNEAWDVDPRAWEHLAVYMPTPQPAPDGWQLLQECRSSVKFDLNRYERMILDYKRLGPEGVDKLAVCEIEANKLQALLDRIDAAAPKEMK